MPQYVLMVQMLGRRDIARRASFWLAAAAAVLVAHDGIYLLELGSGRDLVHALRTAGHSYWPVASDVLLACGIAVAAVWMGRLAMLAWLARHAPRDRDAKPQSSWLRRALKLWPRLLAVVLTAFLLQENLEHLAAHGHGLGLDALGAEHPLSIPVLAVVSALSALIAAVIGRHEAALLLRIAAAALRRTRPSRAIGCVRPQRGCFARLQPLAQHRGLRAPPVLFLPF